MPSANILKSFSVILIGAFMGYSTVHYFQKASAPNRYLASMTMSKMASEQFTKTIFDIKVKESTIGLDDSDVSELIVSLETFKPLPPGLPFNWNLPEDVQIVEGNISGVIPEMGANQIENFVLKVKGFNKQKKSYISFSIKGEVENIKINREILMSSRPEDSFEYVVQQHDQRKREEAKGKVNKTSAYKGFLDPKKVVH
ncbi:MAG: hypothetical protein A2622_06305 [Bdellovibrionales bacterium RIFCSPHIGHO2_01_FULL_40_29]|nr:MAG: hypothetical protein A2622_06305 [Bdellovibrionales bacterium RIFCSPHIGHO2_01_FULL_40_29]OFZ35059.1 MAG: hypothetical protein A3D17_06655 [Bdellovibrionales bacterium RIFCSPHIGHO2_02_FULL_40_15]